MANNDICDSSTDDNGPEHNGLSEFGKQVVGDMNRLGNVSEMGNITLELVKRGYSEKDIRKIWGGNFIRVFKTPRRGA